MTISQHNKKVMAWHLPEYCCLPLRLRKGTVIDIRKMVDREIYIISYKMSIQFSCNLICFDHIMFLLDLHDVLIHIIQFCFTGTGAIIRLKQNHKKHNIPQFCPQLFSCTVTLVYKQYSTVSFAISYSKYVFVTFFQFQHCKTLYCKHWLQYDYEWDSVLTQYNWVLS